jgi:hypothetical protein
MFDEALFDERGDLRLVFCLLARAVGADGASARQFDVIQRSGVAGHG